MSNSTVTNNDVVTQSVSGSSRVTGCVKWFNNKAGYGFITVSNGPHAGDVFVHHSTINVDEEQYRFLVQGEYVEFECVRVEDGPHQWQASNVTGLDSGRLMCETRRAVRSTRSHPHDDQEQEHSQLQRPRQPRQPRQQGQYVQSRDQRSHRPLVARAPSNVSDAPENDGYEWLLVRKYPRNEQGSRGVRPQHADRPRRVRSVVNVDQQ